MDPDNTASTIPASIIKVSLKPEGGVFGTYVGISTTFQTLLDGQTRGLNRMLDADYKISAADAVVNILGRTSGSYKNTIVYQFSQP